MPEPIGARRIVLRGPGVTEPTACAPTRSSPQMMSLVVELGPFGPCVGAANDGATSSDRERRRVLRSDDAGATRYEVAKGSFSQRIPSAVPSGIVLRLLTH